MNILSSLILFISLKSFACAFEQKVQRVISLSGPVTVLLRETGLLKDPRLKGISIFHPVKDDEFKGKIFPGGLFIAQALVTEMEGALLFYDEGKQFERLLKTETSIRGIEIKTRSLAPLAVSELVVEKVSPFVRGCDEKFDQFRKKGRELEAALLAAVGKERRVVFYLGEISETRYPELVIVNDGVVKLLKDKKLLKTYPSELAYVNWSSKLRHQLPPGTSHVGITDSGKRFEQKIKRSSLGMTFSYPGALIPGLSQLEAFVFWAKQK